LSIDILAVNRKEKGGLTPGGLLKHVGHDVRFTLEHKQNIAWGPGPLSGSCVGLGVDHVYERLKGQEDGFGRHSNSDD
jgi:hypothetical protein